jgi:hypothetical protein
MGYNYIQLSAHKSPWTAKGIKDVGGRFVWKLAEHKSPGEASGQEQREARIREEGVQGETAVRVLR